MVPKKANLSDYDKNVFDLFMLWKAVEDVAIKGSGKRVDAGAVMSYHGF